MKFFKVFSSQKILLFNLTIKGSKICIAKNRDQLLLSMQHISYVVFTFATSYLIEYAHGPSLECYVARSRGGSYI